VPVQPPVQLPNGDYYLAIADDFEALLLTGCNGVHASIQELHRRGVRNLIIKQMHQSLLFSDFRRTEMTWRPGWEREENCLLVGK
jgi:hypothetical protein